VAVHGALDQPPVHQGPGDRQFKRLGHASSRDAC
jgi:hypothetical protein